MSVLYKKTYNIIVKTIKCDLLYDRYIFDKDQFRFINYRHNFSLSATIMYFSIYSKFY